MSKRPALWYAFGFAVVLATVLTIACAISAVFPVWLSIGMVATAPVQFIAAVKLLLHGDVVASRRDHRSLPVAVVFGKIPMADLAPEDKEWLREQGVKAGILEPWEMRPTASEAYIAAKRESQDQRRDEARTLLDGWRDVQNHNHFGSSIRSALCQHADTVTVGCLDESWSETMCTKCGTITEAHA